MNIVGSIKLWPTTVMSIMLDDCDAHNKEMVRFMLDRTIPQDHLEELRVFDLEKLGNPSFDWLVNHARNAAQMFIGKNTNLIIKARGVVIRKGCHLRTHTERDESDLAIAYWPTGSYGDEQPIFGMADGFKAPTFCIEDPSRGLCDYRLPNEKPFTFPVAPRAGLMAVFPAHVPHSMFPYLGEEPFIHIVFQVRFLNQPER